MKSTDGRYWIALDHIRALAALLVFCWHFLHGPASGVGPREGAPAIFPLALFDEGHTGVALFMTLSGYLFAKLLDGRKVHFPGFLWNRLLRLAPLLVAVFTLVGALGWMRGDEVGAYLRTLVSGFVLPTWPNGGWSIATELHFYLLLPLILWAGRRRPEWLLAAVAGAVLLRAGIWAITGTIEDLAFWTIFGRIDQFVLGIYLFKRRDLVAGRGGMVAGVWLAFLAAVWWFDARGGMGDYLGQYPSPTPLWIIIPTLEGAAYALLIAWYDSAPRGTPGFASRLWADYGRFSYSIYLLHFFIVFRLAALIHDEILPLTSFYAALPVAVLAFLCMYPLGWLSYRLIEQPFLRFRVRYADLEPPAQVRPS